MKSIACIMILYFSSVVLQAAASYTEDALVRYTMQDALHTKLIGLCVNPRGNHTLLVKQSDPDSMFATFVYSENPLLKEDILNHIAQELSLKLSRRTFQKQIDTSIPKEPEHEPVVSLEHLIALHIKFSRTKHAFEDTYCITTSGFMTGSHARSSCDSSMIVYYPCDTYRVLKEDLRLGFKNIHHAIAQNLQDKHHHRPFHLVVNCYAFEFPRDPAKTFRYSFWSRMSCPDAETYSYWCSITGETKYAEPDPENLLENKQLPKALCLENMTEIACETAT